MDGQSSRAARKLVIAAAAIAVAACGASSVTGSGASTGGQITWQVQNERVLLTNTSAQPVRYAILGRTWMHNALASWCFGSPSCGAPLAAGATATVAYADIDGAQPPEREAIVLWWPPSNTTAGTFDTAIVRIR